MLQKTTIVSFITFSLMLFYGSAWASVVGSWSVKETGSYKYKIQAKTTTNKKEGNSTFVFYENGTFSVNKVYGTWQQPKKRKFIVNLDSDNAFALIKSFCLVGTWDYYVQNPWLVKAKLEGTEVVKSGMTTGIKGTMNFVFKFYMSGTSLVVTNTLALNFNSSSKLKSIRKIADVYDVPASNVLEMKVPDSHQQSLLSSTFSRGTMADGTDIFVEIKSQYNQDAGVKSGVILVSKDGLNWDIVNYRGHLLYAVSFGSDTFIAVGSGGRILISADGSNWETVESANISEDLIGVAYREGIFVAWGKSEREYISSDGHNWSETDAR